MDIWDVRERLIENYKSFTTAFVDIRDRRVKEYVENQLLRGDQWPEPWISLNPGFATGGMVIDLVDERLLHEECRRIYDQIAKAQREGKPCTSSVDGIEVVLS